METEVAASTIVLSLTIGLMKACLHITYAEHCAEVLCKKYRPTRSCRSYRWTIRLKRWIIGKLVFGMMRDNKYRLVENSLSWKVARFEIIPSEDRSSYFQTTENALDCPDMMLEGPNVNKSATYVPILSLWYIVVKRKRAAKTLTM